MSNIRKVTRPNLPYHSPVLSVQRKGWCVYAFHATDESQIVSGPYTDEGEAKKAADELNNIHKETV